jgi:hypothetical protein
VPLQSVLNLKNQEIAFQFPTGSISLGFCKNCEFISNYSFQSELMNYCSGYEATQNYSTTFRAFAARQAQKIIDLYQLKSKTLLEIGCGNGEFLSLLCELGDNTGIGFDPTYMPGRVESKPHNRLTFIKDYFSLKYAHLTADFIFCKMTLEHIRDVGDFIAMLRKAIGSRKETIVFFQVPDVTRILAQAAFEDIYYEHCSYFSPSSLAALFRQSRFQVINTETEYNGQYTTIEARPVDSHKAFELQEESGSGLDDLVNDFSHKTETKLTKWRQRLSRLHLEGKKTVVWGGGSKAVAFLTALNVDGQIQHVVDINPHRQNTYMPKIGYQIRPPEILKEYMPDAVIIMNEIYIDEIRKKLATMDLYPKLLTP